MNSVGYLLIGLIITMGAYTFYRQVFLKNNKKITPKKPHFTLKIEPE